MMGLGLGLGSGGGGIVINSTNLYAQPKAASTIESAPQGRTLFAVPNVPNGVTATISPNDGRFQVSGTGASTVIQAGASTLSAGSVDVTVSAQGMGSVTVPVEVGATPTALVAAATAIHGLFLIKSGYAGAACQVQAVHATTGALLGSPFDVAFTSSTVGAHIDYAAMYATAAGEAGAYTDRVRVIQVYDQNGTKHLTTLDTATKIGPWMMQRYQRLGMQPISFAGNRGWNVGGTVDGPDNRLVIPTTINGNRNNFSVFMAVEPHSSRNIQGYIMWGTTAYTWQLRTSPTQFVGLSTSGGTHFDSGVLPRAQASVIGYSATASNRALYFREQEYLAGSADASGGMNAGGYIGNSDIVAQATYSASMEWWGTSFHMTAGLNSSDSLSMYNFWRILTNAPTQFTSRYVADGDSIEQNVLGFRDNYGGYQIARRQLIGNPECFNLAIAGQRMDGSLASNNGVIQRIASQTALYTSSMRVVYEVRAGTNDPAPVSTIYAAHTLFTSTLKALGGNVRVVIDTITGLAGSVPTDLNVLINANTAGADAVVNYEETAPGAMAAYTDVAYFGFPPGTGPADVHPNETAHALMAPYRAAVVNAQLVGTV